MDVPQHVPWPRGGDDGYPPIPARDVGDRAPERGTVYPGLFRAQSEHLMVTYFEPPSI